jgi:hypothetical protein
VAAVNYDLYLELWSRSLHEVLPDARLTRPQGRVVMPELNPPDVPPATPDDVVLPNTPADQEHRRHTVVVFSGEDVNRSGLGQWLRQAGFPIQQRTNGSGDATNSIVFGDSVALDDLKAVALQASRVGLHIQRIRGFEAPGHGNEIEFGYVHHASMSTPWTVEQIKALRRLPSPAQP